MWKFTNFISTSQESVVDNFLEFNKWEFTYYDKETKSNIKVDLSQCIIVDLWYTIKWKYRDNKVWKFTYNYYSNEIKSFDEKFFVFRSDYKNNELIESWLWQHIKSNVEQYNCPRLNIAITVYNKLTWKVQELFLEWLNYFNVNQTIKAEIENLEHYYFKFVCETKYTNKKKDSEWHEIRISKEELDKMPRDEAMEYNNKRYTVSLVKLDKIDAETLDLIKPLETELSKYHEGRKAFYENRYGNGKKWEMFIPESQLEEDNYEYKPTTNVNSVETKTTPTVDTSNKELSIEDLPF